MSETTAVLIYDADCPMCRASALWLMRLALSRGALEILPCRSPVRAMRFPSLREEACMSAMQLVLPDGRILAGADAVPELLRRIRGLGWLATLFGLPTLQPVARRVYGWIARHRMRLSCAATPAAPHPSPR
jgi:predicted DCC family thiol-disulfide oxidoreductase YuxK